MRRFTRTLVLAEFLLGALAPAVAEGGREQSLSPQQPQQPHADWTLSERTKQTPPARVSRAVVLDLGVTDDIIRITFPDRLGGETLTARLEGRLRLLIEAPAFPARGSASLRIVAAREVITGLRLPKDSRGYSESDSVTEFVLESPILSKNESRGTIDLAGGEYELTYVIRPDPGMYRHLGIPEIGPIVVEERGRLFSNGEKVTLTTSGSLAIETGHFVGTKITYSPKGGTGTKHPVYDILLQRRDDCSFAGNVGIAGAITGASLHNDNSFPAYIWHTNDANGTRDGPMPANSWGGGQAWNGRYVRGVWELMDTASGCGNPDDTASLQVEYSP